MLAYDSPGPSGTLIMQETNGRCSNRFLDQKSYYWKSIAHNDKKVISEVAFTGF